MAAAEGPPRKHVVIFSRSCLFLDSEGDQAELNKELASSSDQFMLCFTSHDEPSPDMLKAIPESMLFKQRGGELRAFIKERWDDGDVVIIVGAVNEDLYAAASTKSFLIGAGWVDLEDKVVQYGIPAPTPSKMIAILRIIVNQSSWYYECTFNDPIPTKVVTLCSGNTRSFSSRDEKDIAERFEAILKKGNKEASVRKALICHLMSAIAHDEDFREVQDWAIAPSSTTQPSPVMEELKEHVRCMMNGRKPEPIFIRHKKTSKSRFDKLTERQRADYCQKHFDSIVVNKLYKNKLRGRVVCVLDDYLTHGNTFETLRNLLLACGAKKIIFVAIGKFRFETEYFKKSFTINGDVHAPGYTATFDKDTPYHVHINHDARRSLEKLKELASYLE